MPRVKISFEAEIGDLASYYPDDPPGIMRENTIRFLYGLLREAIDGKLSVHGELPNVKAAMLRHYSDDEKLATRLMNNVKLEMLP